MAHKGVGALWLGSFDEANGRGCEVFETARRLMGRADFGGCQMKVDEGPIQPQMLGDQAIDGAIVQRDDGWARAVRLDQSDLRIDFGSVAGCEAGGEVFENGVLEQAGDGDRGSG